MVQKNILATFIVTAVAAFGVVRAQGNCTSLDLEYICQNTEYVQGIAADCGLACLSEGEECLEACMV
ncbi:MAG TPA: hypothetical protein DDZ19_02620, partial [Flavobacteriales bacterium]|nr:hypothetical protein [Flavobacteriales bacterium]